MWKEENDKLYRRFVFNDYDEAVGFMNKIAVIATSLNHHPTISNTYNKVDIWLSTHDDGDRVTDKDQEFTRQVDDLFVVKDTSEKTKLFPKEAKLYTDGGSRGNPGPSASGYVILDMDDNLLIEQGDYLGITTNNQAEYQALKFGLERAHKLGVQFIDVYMDSMLVVNQMEGIFKIKNRDLWPIHAAIVKLAKTFKKITYTHVPRELNQLADSQVNKCLDAEAKADSSDTRV